MWDVLCHDCLYLPERFELIRNFVTRYCWKAQQNTSYYEHSKLQYTTDIQNYVRKPHGQKVHQHNAQKALFYHSQESEKKRIKSGEILEGESMR